MVNRGGPGYDFSRGRAGPATGPEASVALYALDEGNPLRVGLGHDTHRLVEGRPLILGGVRIDHPRGLLGHSDADVVLHAVADALLGAAALGDIGEHYPDTDPEWEGLDSSQLLAEVVERVGRSGWSPINCDLTIHAQAPKLLSHKAALRANVARLLGLDPTAVNVKAKTGEQVGPIGRAEAISCDAIILVGPAPARPSIESEPTESKGDHAPPL